MALVVMLILQWLERRGILACAQALELLAELVGAC